MIKIETVGQLKQALQNFSDDTPIQLNISDEFDTYGIEGDIVYYAGPGMDDDKPAFFNNGHCRIDIELRAEEWGPDAVPVKAKVVKIKEK